TGRIERVVDARWVAMRVHENVALDPRVGAVEIEMVVTRAIEDVVDDLENRSGPLAAREINRVVETPGVAEIIVAENPVARDGNAVDPVQTLRPARRRIRRENAVLHDEGTGVE